MVYGTGILLLTAVAGYWVLERSSAHKGNLKRVGQALGWIVIVASLLGVACRVYALATGKVYCPPDSCPFTQKSVQKSGASPSQSR